MTQQRSIPTEEDVRPGQMILVVLGITLFAATPFQARAQGFMNIDGNSYAYFETSALIDRIGCTAVAPRKCNTSPTLVGDRVIFVGLEYKSLRNGFPLSGFGDGYNLVSDLNAMSNLSDHVLAGDQYRIVLHIGDMADAYYQSTHDFRCSEDDSELICHILFYGVVQDGSAGQYIALDGFYVFDSKNLFWTLVDGLAGVATVLDILN